MSNSNIQVIEERPTIEIGSGGTIRLEKPNVEVLSIGSQGLKGIKGDTGATGATGETGATGDGDRNYVHVQNTPLAHWTVVHNLGKYPAITVVDSGGTEVVGQVNFVSTAILTIDFSGAFSGKAFIN